jgi:hypothetical protein
MFGKTVLRGQICPIAELAGKKQCLGALCLWHKPNTKTKCILTEIAAIFPMVCEMKKNIDYISDSIARAETECERGGWRSMSVRNLVFMLSLRDSVRDRLLEVKKQLLDLDGTTATPLIKVGAVGQEALARAKSSIADAGKSMSASNLSANTSLKTLSTSTINVRENILALGDKGKDALKGIQDQAKSLNDSVGNLVGSFAAMAGGGAIAGLSWKEAVQSGISADQLYEKFDRSKSFGVSGDKLKTWSESFEGVGYTDPNDMRQMADTVYNYGGKSMKGDKGLKIAEEMARVQAGRAEGLGLSPETFMRLMSSSGPLPALLKGKMSDALGAAGVTDPGLNSKKGRERLLESYAGSKSIQEGIDSQPWIAATYAIEDMQKAVGKSLIPTMDYFCKTFTNVVNVLKDIPAVPQFIGIAGIGIALVGTFSLLSAVLGSAVAGVRMLASVGSFLASVGSVLTSVIFRKTATTVADTAANVAETATTSSVIATLSAAAVAMEMAAVAMTALVHAQGAGVGVGLSLASTEDIIAESNIANAGTTEAAAAATAVQTTVNNVAGFSFKALALSVWSALAPILLILVPLAILGGVLYYVESKTHIFSKALKELGKSEMAHDVLDWFRGVGHWINDSIRGLDNFYKALKGGDLGSKLGGGLKFAGTMLMGPFGLILKPLVDLMTNSVDVQNVIRKLIEIGLTIFQKIADFTLWVWHGILVVTP